MTMMKRSVEGQIKLMDVDFRSGVDFVHLQRNKTINYYLVAASLLTKAQFQALKWFNIL